MLCKIAESRQNVTRVLWRQIRTGSVNPAKSVSPEEAPPAIVAELKQRVAQLQQSRESEILQARQTGFEEGLRQGREESASDLKTSSERLAQTLANLTALKSKLRGEAETELLKLSLAVARRILHRELLTDQEALQGVVYSALQKIQKKEVWRVRVYPAGSGVVRSCLERLGIGSIEIVPDPALKTGDLLIETSAGELDASVDTQLQEIERGFADRLCLR